MDCDIIVGTHQICNIDLFNQLGDVSLIIFDEADLILGRKHVQMVMKHLPMSCQIIALSSSQSDSWLQHIPPALLPPMNILAYAVPPKSNHYFLKCAEDKIKYLVAICVEIQSHGSRTIIFCVSTDSKSLLLLLKDMIFITINKILGQQSNRYSQGRVGESWRNLLYCKRRNGRQINWPTKFCGERE